MSCILLVEDDHDLREMLRTSLVRRKYIVSEASNGKEALLRFKPSMTDLVITDLIMPDEDGLKVIMKIKELKPEVKIIAISGGGKAGPGNYLDLAKYWAPMRYFPNHFRSMIF
jgi:DNA-binding NtrC family response regulator